MSGILNLEAIPLVDPPEPRLILVGGVELAWSNGAACLIFPATERITRNGEEAVAVDAQLIQNLTLNSLNQQLRSFEESWFAWSHCPGHYGARPQKVAWRAHSGRPENIVWLGSNSSLDTVSAFGRPRMEFQRNKWLVIVEGLSDPVQQILWDDKEAIAQAVSQLDDWDYWKSLAALMHPESWRRAVQNEEIHRRHARAALARQKQDEEMALVFSAPNLLASTRKLARLLRRFQWGSDSSTQIVRNVTMLHCDVRTPGGSPARIAECLEIGWVRGIDIQTRREIGNRLNTYLAPHGYGALLTRAGRIYISRDKELARNHLHSIARHRLDSPTVNIL